MKRCMNKALIEMLRTDLQEAIKGVEEKYKLHITVEIQNSLLCLPV